MRHHLRANLWLLMFTVVVCSLAYPLALWCVGQTVFRAKANGSLVDKDGHPTADDRQAVGSRLIAQPFTGDEYFHPRPSAVGYNGAASGATNWGASNPALRKRVAGTLGGVLKYRDGRPVAPDVVAWARQSLPNEVQALPADANGDADIASAFFEQWWAAHSTADVQPVPADMVMASGSGLDPHITLDNARYQLDRVASAWAATANRDPADVRKEIEALLAEKAEAPLGGLVGVDLVNVFEVNLAIRNRFGS